MSRFRLATYNLEDLGPRRGRKNFSTTQLDALRTRLIGLDADIICLQELNAGRGRDRKLDILDVLLRGTPYAGYDRLVSSGRTSGRPLDVHNLAILSRWSIGQGQQYWNDFVAPPVFRRGHTSESTPDTTLYWDRPVLHASIGLPNGQPLHVINVHFKAPRGNVFFDRDPDSKQPARVEDWAEGFYMSAIKRAGQALEVRHVVDNIFDGDGHALIAVCGDYNAETLEVPLRIICGAVVDTGVSELALRALDPVEIGVAPETRFSIIHEGRPLLVDHILVSKALAGRVGETGIDNVDLPDEAEANDAAIRQAGSLHAALYVTFRI